MTSIINSRVMSTAHQTSGQAPKLFAQVCSEALAGAAASSVRSTSLRGPGL